MQKFLHVRKTYSPMTPKPKNKNAEKPEIEITDQGTFKPVGSEILNCLFANHIDMNLYI